MEPDRIRASDADRDRTAARLRDALAEGRIGHDELEERLDAVYRARTLGELAPVTHDLPPAAGTGPASPAEPVGMTVSSEEARRLAAESQGRETVSAVFGGVERAGRWLVEPHTNVSVLCGGIELDLREAVLSQREVVIQCAVALGGLEMVVPHGVRVVSSVNAILGGVDMSKVDNVTDPNAPTIRLTGTCLLGGVEVRTKAPKKKRKW
ncbi:DUF1707 SHOCT-like domain-containing protein [Actinorugispora endophytica]|uniref:Cell wall-active antibiotic response 4TMS protein YvqF n=1 Tax=Actinorugispora endophytica TaxID=1605990 RepID=A0A4R6V4S6_9ACTN|nr:DUF1707 domain-containing protein [Actinorugispora endophytica]TDQ55341.1 cell wall-active antibiotic response 4TMS protein YvqF [Actinorugispora endophytica]